MKKYVQSPQWHWLLNKNNNFLQCLQRPTWTTRKLSPYNIIIFQYYKQIFKSWSVSLVIHYLSTYFKCFGIYFKVIGEYYGGFVHYPITKDFFKGEIYFKMSRSIWSCDEDMKLTKYLILCLKRWYIPISPQNILAIWSNIREYFVNSEIYKFVKGLEVLIFKHLLIEKQTKLLQ